jgi:hypothetical protein
MGGRTKEGRKQASGEIKEKDAGGRSFACTTRKLPRTKDDSGNKRLWGLAPGAVGKPLSFPAARYFVLIILDGVRSVFGR